MFGINKFFHLVNPVMRVNKTVESSTARRELRHPEKAHRPDNVVMRKPPWIRVKAPVSSGFHKTRNIIQSNSLVTVCEEASCPNIGECWSKQHATFMIMGDTCTRGCTFCNVATGKPSSLDLFEPGRVAEAVRKLALKHVVVTSVDRDDLDDGGAQHFATTVRSIRKKSPDTTIELLVPDFLNCHNSTLEVVLDTRPDVFNHNVETVPALYPTVRPGARYFHSVNLLYRAKHYAPDIFTKSGLMVGLGEDKSSIVQVMDDLRSANVDFLTIGQYLQPTPKHHPVVKFLHPDEFKALEHLAYGKGFMMVSASPMTRSSYHAEEDFQKLKSVRMNSMQSA